MTGGAVAGVVFEYVLAATLGLSFQRYPCPSSAVVGELPRSWGALPIADVGSRELLVPVPRGEAVWVGLLASAKAPAWSVRIVVHLEPQGATDAVTGRPVDDPAGGPTVLSVPPRRHVEGVRRREGGWWALTRAAPVPGAPSCSGLEIMAAQARVRLEPLAVHLVEPTDFRARCGIQVPPLRPDAPYGGWRLP